MKVGKFTAVFLSVVFFVIVASVTAISIGSLFPSFSFSDNWFVRIVLLFITFIIARKFYDFIYGDVEVKEGKNKVAVYSDEDNKRKIVVFGIVLVFIIGIVYISAVYCSYQTLIIIRMFLLLIILIIQMFLLIILMFGV